MRFTNLILLIAICCISIVACTNTNDTPPIISIPTQTSIPITETPIPPTQTITPTTIPTLSVDDAHKRLLDLLANNDGCQLPCLWGIAPGKSSFQDAQAILAPLSSVSNFTAFDSELGLGSIMPSSPVQNNLEIYSTLDFLANKGNHIVNRIAFKTEAHKPLEQGGYENIFGAQWFGERVKAYELSNVLSDQGVPAAVLIQTFNSLSSLGQHINGGFEILLLYPDQGLLVHYTTQLQIIGKNIRGCPAAAQVDMQLLPAGYADSFAQNLSQTEWAGIWPLPNNKPYWTSIEQATSMSTKQFYEIFHQPTNQCIETPANLWPAPFR